MGVGGGGGEIIPEWYSDSLLIGMHIQIEGLVKPVDISKRELKVKDFKSRNDRNAFSHGLIDADETYRAFQDVLGEAPQIFSDKSLGRGFGGYFHKLHQLGLEVIGETYVRPGNYPLDSDDARVRIIEVVKNYYIGDRIDLKKGEVGLYQLLDYFGTFARFGQSGLVQNRIYSGEIREAAKRLETKLTLGKKGKELIRKLREMGYMEEGRDLGIYPLTGVLMNRNSLEAIMKDRKRK